MDCGLRWRQELVRDAVADSSDYSDTGIDVKRIDLH